MAQSVPIAVAGNKRVESATVIRYSGLSLEKAVSDADLNNAIKQLYDTGFFAEVSIDKESRGLQINVTENPMVNDVRFEGNKHLESDKLKGELQLHPRSIYTRPKVQEDVARLLELYRRSGRFSAVVKPTLVQLDQNRVDIVYEITEGEVTRIGNIEFIGNHQFGDSTLKDVVKTTTSCWYCFLTDDDKYDPDRVAYDKELLRRFYTKQGFADFQVKSVVSELSPQKDAFFLTFTLDEGTRYRIGDITFQNALPGFTKDELLDAVVVEKDELYSAEGVEHSIDGLVKAMGDRGFAFVDVEPLLTRHPEKKTIDVGFKIAEGPRVYVERINIEGNMRTLDEVIRREFRLSEGDPYSTSKLQRSEQRLKNLGFFEDVKVTTARGSAPDRVVVNVNVTEQSTGEVTLGAGFSSADGALADFGIRERNLLGRGQDLRFKGTFAQRRQEFDIGFTEPYFLGRDVAAGFDLFDTTEDLRTESSFDRKSVGGRLRLGYSLTENLRHDLYYSFLQSDITNLQTNASRFIREQEGKNTTSLVGQSLTYDRLDNKLDPTEGYYLKGDVDVAGLGGDSKFVRPEAKASAYHSFAPQWILSVSGTAGYVYALDDRIAIQDRFFIGGRDIRGFANAGLGPRDTSTKDALGGNAYYTGSTELQFPIGLPEDLGFRGAVFVDAGSLFDVDDKAPEIADDSSLRASTGVGLAWKSPFGPVRLDFARAFLKQDYDIDETFRFSFGTRF